jgi:hypothetical protein
MFASFGISVLLCVPALILAGPATSVMVGVVIGHVVVSLTLFRYSRAIFLGLDYLLDPAAPPDDDDAHGTPRNDPRPGSGAQVLCLSEFRPKRCGTASAVRRRRPGRDRRGAAAAARRRTLAP